jgi:hypothetical protein
MPGCLWKTLALDFAVCLGVAAQTIPAASPGSAGTDALLSQLQELRAAISEMRDQLAGSIRESQELRRELQAVRGQLDGLRSGPADDRVAAIAEEQQLLGAKVQEQYQTKVESGSKYRVRLSGLALLNVFSTHGTADNIDVPTVAQPRVPGDSNGSFGATVRQSLLNLEVVGPELAGAKTSGSVAFDFFGGFPITREGFSVGLVRLRTAKLTLDWPNTSIVAGQDTPFFSPLSPTSLASTAYPALSSSGNLWTWTPQVYVERRIAVSDKSKVLVQGGILDSLAGELAPDEYNRTPTAGERSRTPAYALRLGWQRAADEHTVAIGAGAYYARQNWGFDRTVDAWAATADWDLPLGRMFSFSGELYRGRSIAGLGASASPSVLFSANSVLGLNSTGGWSQIKVKPTERMQLNAAFGEDYAFRSGLGPLFTPHYTRESPVNRNATGLFNVIYQARSNLLFSVEYRRLWTSRFEEGKVNAGHVNLAAGIVF